MWSGFLPPEKGLPGDPLDAATNPFTLASYLLRCVDLLKTLMLSVDRFARLTTCPGKPRPDLRSALDEMIDLDSSFDSAQSPEAADRAGGRQGPRRLADDRRGGCCRR